MKGNPLYDVAIIGAGVVGSALLYTLSKYTNIERLALIEKYSEPGKVNSHRNNNSQTLHFGDIETNYTVEKARKVKEAAEMVANYVTQTKHNKPLYQLTQKMVLAVGSEQVKTLTERHKEFKKLFPNLKKIGRKELAKLEPKILENRDPNEEVLALYSPNGYAIDYGELAKSFTKQANKKGKKIDYFYHTKVKKISKADHYEIQTNHGLIKAKVVIVAAGSHSLIFAQNLGYGKDYGLLPVAGSFFRSRHKLLNGKVYTLQMKKLPFAAIHGDPHVLNPNETRFGPTAKVLPILERHKPHSFFSFLKTSSFTFAGIASLVKIISDPILFRYIIRNFTYDLPWFGKRSFLKEVQKIVPSVQLKDLEFSKKIGGIRPQIVNTKTRSLEMGEAKITGDNIIFNITPSPGASTCLKNAREDAERIVQMLGKNYKFELEKFNKDLLGSWTKPQNQ